LLTHQQLARLLSTSPRRIAGLQAQLAKHGWVCAASAKDLANSTGYGISGQLEGFVLMELTSAGRREAARRLLVAGPVAERRHGLLGVSDSRGGFLRHLEHTLGTNEVFVTIAEAARCATQRGGDEALEEWRSAAACARTRFRPDGYGCYRRGRSRFGFFLEYDRGTERRGEYATKLAAYYRYRVSGQSTRDYDGFPTLLVVTTSDVAETRFAYQAYLAQQHHPAAPLLVFLTTLWRIQTHPESVLGPIWCTPGPNPWTYGQRRVRWLPSLESHSIPTSTSQTPTFRSRDRN
jgi:hypothetical protein